MHGVLAPCTHSPLLCRRSLFNNFSTLKFLFARTGCCFQSRASGRFAHGKARLHEENQRRPGRRRRPAFGRHLTEPPVVISTGVWYNNPDVLTLWGVLETIEPAYCSVAAETNGVLQSYAMQLMNNVTFLKYNRAKEEFQPITQHELAAGQKVYIIKQSGNQTIVVY